jgi:hypothetical protein
MTAVDSRAEYLSAAADVLLTSSPAVAAHLRSVRQEVAAGDDGKSAQQSGSICSACGETLIPGWSCTLVGKDENQARRLESLKQRPQTKTVRMKCSRCNTISTVTSTKPPRDGQKRTKTATTVSITDAMTTSGLAPSRSEPSSTLASTIVVGRKARGKKSSLQALLAGQQSGAKPSVTTGLNISDFIKK